MSIFFVEQDRTRVFGEAYSMYVAAVNPRRTMLSGKKTIYGWGIIPKLSDYRGLPALGSVAADTRKMSFRYSHLCGMASDAVGAVRSAIPKGFKF